MFKLKTTAAVLIFGTLIICLLFCEICAQILCHQCKQGESLFPDGTRCGVGHPGYTQVCFSNESICFYLARDYSYTYDEYKYVARGCAQSEDEFELSNYMRQMFPDFPIESATGEAITCFCKSGFCNGNLDTCEENSTGKLNPLTVVSILLYTIAARYFGY